MCFILEALVAVLCAGGVGLAEHPSAPDDESAASIWRTPLVSLLLSLPECELVTMAQGLWGAPSTKPTSLFVINAPTMAASLRKWQVTTTLPKGVSIGVDDSGNWSTSKLKEYPPAMSGGLAEGILQAIQSLPQDLDLAVSEQFRSICRKMYSVESSLEAPPAVGRRGFFNSATAAAWRSAFVPAGVAASTWGRRLDFSIPESSSVSA
eukprot:s2459_g12.t1